jgi:hypothetical protein
MNARLFLAIVSTAALAIPATAQVQRRATMTGGGSGVAGHCTGEVVVDGAADLQIRGDTATVRDVSGQQPQIRSFQCTSPMPATASLRANVNGRGNARVVAMPSNGSPAVIHIEDREGGASTYQFDISWGDQGSNNQGSSNQGYAPPAADRRDSDRGYGYNNGGGRFTAEQAVNVCRDAIRQQAMDRFGTRDVNVGRIHMDDNPGRNDWVVGNVNVRHDQYPSSCSVNFDSGRVRSAQIDAPSNQGDAGRSMVDREMDTCRNAVVDRLGGGRVEFGDMNVDPDGDTVRGGARGREGWVNFACHVNQYNGNVRNVDIWRR